MAAAAARKLQKEIDTTLKKVEEQRQEFSEVWEEAMNANAAHREKLGEELKRCINKLQRSRVQIREWIAAEKTEQKTMDRLEESRRRIEKDMQRFKEFERELKTKAYSTQALLKEEDMDVLCVEKKQNIEWLILQLHNLHDLQDEVEADLESLTKKEESRRVELTAQDERHRWHLEKLERLLRSLQNDEVDMTELAVLKEIVEDYMERHKEAEYFHDDNMYDVFFTDEPCANSKDEADTGTPNAAASQKSTDFADIAGACKTSVSSAPSAKKPKERKKKDKGAKVPPRAEPIKAEKKCTRTTDASLDKDSEKKPPQEVKIQEDQLVGEAEEFICKICYVHVVGNGPFLTNCSHLFCGDCLQEWFQTHPECQSWAQRAKATGPQRIVPCPVCKQNLNEKTDLYPVCSTSMRSENLLLWRMLSSLKVMCKNHPKVCPEGNCDWIGEYGTYQAHIQACENIPVMNHAAKDGKSSVNAFREQSTLSMSISSAFKQESPPVRASSSSASSALPDTKPAVKTVKSVSQAGCEAKSSSAVPKAKAQPPTPNHVNNVDGVDADSGRNVMPAVNASSIERSLSQHADTLKELYHSTSSFLPSGHSGKGQIPVAEADTIEVFQQHDSGWSYGKVYTPEGACAEGWFPSWIVGSKIQLQEKVSSQSLPEAPTVPVEVKTGNIRFPVQNAFSSTDSSQLSLAVGDVVEVIERHPTGWTFGRLLSSDKEGWFPDWVGAASVC